MDGQSQIFEEGEDGEEKLSPVTPLLLSRREEEEDFSLNGPKARFNF